MTDWSTECPDWHSLGCRPVDSDWTCSEYDTEGLSLSPDDAAYESVDDPPGGMLRLANSDTDTTTPDWP